MIVYGSLRYEPLWGKVLIKLSHLLLCLSSAVNIIIYSYKVNISVVDNRVGTGGILVQEGQLLGD